jgi:hypothetical protein
MCKDESLASLGKSTCFKILDKCSASFRKSMQGLDNMKADGLDSFDKLESLIQTLANFGLNQNEFKQLKNSIDSIRNYLKFNYIKNLSKSCICSDHCVNYALSDDKNGFLAIKCEHLHERNCEKCNTLDALFDMIQNNINLLINDSEFKKIQTQYLKNSKEKIIEWKFHIIRNWNQDIIKYKLLNDLKPNEIYIHCDWAMKFLPLKFRETQEDFFGKRGLSWHITCLVYNNLNETKTKTLLHLFDSVSQDSNCVLGILDNSFTFTQHTIHTTL